MKVAVLGAGSWGSALAIQFARGGHGVALWSRDSGVAESIRKDGRHPRRLTGIAIPSEVQATSDLATALAGAEIVVLTVPCASYRDVLASLPASSGSPRRFLSTAKGLDPDTGRRMSELIREAAPRSPAAALSGPTFAEGVARGDPSAAVVADSGDGLAEELQSAFSTPELRLYSSKDLVGVELCGALKNVVAIAAGIVSGLGFGPNTLAALVTRGLAEIERIVRGRGGSERTVHGLAGVGDLMLTCTGQQSRNRFVGEQVGRGRALADILAVMPEVAEGARTCLAVPTMAARVGTEAPIAEAVVRVLYEGRGASRRHRETHVSCAEGRVESGFALGRLSVCTRNSRLETRNFFSGGLFRLENADRQDDRLEPGELEPALDREGRLVVQDAVVELVVLEDELAEEEDGARELLAGPTRRARRTCSTASVPTVNR